MRHAHLALAVLLPATAFGQTVVRVDPRPVGPASRLLTGACLEDVNHEVYGGIDSQLIFGESFAEPPVASTVHDFTPFGGAWAAADGVLSGDGGPGPKLVSALAPFPGGTVGVDVMLPGPDAGNAGLVVGVTDPGDGPDAFNGYEVSLDAAAHTLRLGRHHHDYRLVRDVPCDVRPDRWATLAVTVANATVEVAVDGKTVLRADDTDPPTAAGTVGLRQWNRPARYRNLAVTVGGTRTPLPFVAEAAAVRVSGMWPAVQSGSATLAADVVADRPFSGGQCQRVTFAGGTGDAGIANRGLNRCGLNVVAGRPYDGYLWVRGSADAAVSLESRDGARRYAAAPLPAGGDTDADGWRKVPFALTPDAADTHGQFAIRLRSPGTLDVGYAFLQSGDRFHGLPVRRDVAEALVDQGVTVLRYGGSMVNAPGYRWKNMVGPRDRRPPYRGTWYPYSSNGWGVFEFLNLCEAMCVVPVPDLNVDETPSDLADFIEYANGPPDSPWGKRRAADGHPQPYGLTHLELGNEERVDAAYAAKFAALADAVWARDPHLILVVGDFEYTRPIADPTHVVGATSGIASLDAHRQILDVARRHGGTVWFDVHVWTERPPASRPMDALPSYVDAIDHLAGGANHAVVVFELNANRHDVGRAVANAQAIVRCERDGRVPVVASANCLQPDGQNDNGWDQGLVFLNPEATWLQPPGLVTQLFARSYQPQRLACAVTAGPLEASAAASDDGRTVVLHVVNPSAETVAATFDLGGFRPDGPVTFDELTGPADGRNTADRPRRVAPSRFAVSDATKHTFPPRSVTTVRFESVKP